MNKKVRVSPQGWRTVFDSSNAKILKIMENDEEKHEKNGVVSEKRKNSPSAEANEECVLCYSIDDKTDERLLRLTIQVVFLAVLCNNNLAVYEVLSVLVSVLCHYVGNAVCVKLFVGFLCLK